MDEWLDSWKTTYPMYALTVWYARGKGEMTNKKTIGLEKDELLKAILKSEAKMNALEARINAKARELKRIQTIKLRSKSISIQPITGKASIGGRNSNLPYNSTNKHAQGYYDLNY